SMNFAVDFDSDNFRFVNMDSLLKEITVNVETLDSGRTMMFITSDMEEAMEGMEKRMNAFTYNFENELSDGDSLIRVFVKQLNFNSDSMMKTHFKHMNIDSDDGKIIIYSDGEEVKIDDDGKIKVIKLGKDAGKTLWSGDTIIEDGNSKIIIKSTKGGDDLEQTIEYIISDEDSDLGGKKNSGMKVMKVKGANTIWVGDDGEVHELDADNFEFVSDGDSARKMKVKVINKNGNMTVWVDEDGEVHELEGRDYMFESGDENTPKQVKVKVIKKDSGQTIWISDDKEVFMPDGAKYEFQPASAKDKEDLKSAGVKTKDRELLVENMKFSPNPSNGKFNLSFTLKEKKKITINIYDINGNVVYTETLKDFQGEYSKEIDISNQESGTFFLQIVQGLYDIIKKIIIQ
ncbi:MAG: T9SS type A sorting domain-containing protein, partial [Bacteroidales bacterium]|nr:T9SS type A sorting domain-containing protein [Bacteroidales bacterium]